ncbi:MAG TPA: GNAT family N-acetyltransferase [Candidatus Eisenbacteria bacterium]|nr:GNAT family N-acetyltransferase [Candidatus Eisenbacteria bacterium]
MAPPTIDLPLAMVAGHEAIEETAETDWFRAATPTVVAATGLGVEDLGSVRLYFMPRVDVLMFNRAVGIGIGHPATEDEIDRIVARYRDRGVSRFLVTISPASKPDSIAPWLEARGFRAHNAWVKLHREAERVPEIATAGLRIEEIGPDRALEFGKVVQAGFSMIDIAGEWVGLTVGRPGWRHYLALDGDKAVGAAAMYLRGPWAWFGFAATLEEARGRGAQSALIARRVTDAHVAGVRWLSIETAQDTPERDAPSFRNVARQGFQVAYLRPNWIWKAPGA